VTGSTSLIERELEVNHELTLYQRGNHVRPGLDVKVAARLRCPVGPNKVKTLYQVLFNDGACASCVGG
jgi:hypothetical protein